MRARRLLHVSLTVRSLQAATAFYLAALGFTADGPAGAAEPALAAALGARTLRVQRLHRGGQSLELAEFDPPGAPCPRDATACDLCFQHIALVTDDIDAAHARLRGAHVTPISSHGPQTLPGGTRAFKFRDPDGHPLELIALADPDPATSGGIDHSAISVADADASIRFYAATLGLRVHARQVNAGPAQDALDGLTGANLDVVALQPDDPAPHVELLAYHTPRGRPAPPRQPADIAATRLVFAVDRLPDGTAMALHHDPDGHALLLVASPS